MVEKSGVIEDEDISPASIPQFRLLWSEKRSSTNTTLKEEKTIRFDKSSSFRFERTEEQFYSGVQTIDLRIRYTNTSYHWVCLGIACEENLKGNKGLYYFQKSIMYSSYYPKVTQDQTDVNYKKFTVNDKDRVSITMNFEDSTIEFIHNDVSLGEAKVNLNNGSEWYFIVGMFEGEVDILD
mmetsp:Transcript_20240/g.21042  ORF Transcript_20240/g.21042 Transcript_20240/m.21042 type:complete len:181 (-) Transcript_20240:29-571(-)